MFNENMISGGSSQAGQEAVQRSHIVSLKSSSSQHGSSSRTEEKVSELLIVDHSEEAFISTRVFDLTDDDAFMSGGSLQRGEGTVVSAKRCERKPGQKYLFGDFFSGAGGASCGAKLAGLAVKFGLDCWPTAIQTFQKNFPLVELHQTFVDKFIRSMGRDACAKLYVDVLHISPPCQYWSPAHTIPGKEDDRNMAALFFLDCILRISKCSSTQSLTCSHRLGTPRAGPSRN